MYFALIFRCTVCDIIIMLLYTLHSTHRESREYTYLVYNLHWKLMLLNASEKVSSCYHICYSCCTVIPSPVSLYFLLAYHDIRKQKPKSRKPSVLSCPVLKNLPLQKTYWLLWCTDSRDFSNKCQIKFSLQEASSYQHTIHTSLLNETHFNLFIISLRFL